MRRESWEVKEKTESRIAELLSALGEIRISECKERGKMLWRRQGERSIVVQYRFALGDFSTRYDWSK